MHLIDTHIHLYAEEYEGRQEELISEAVQAGVRQFLMPNIDRTSLEGMHLLADKYPGVCFAMMGLHPCYVKENFEEELAVVSQLLQKGTYKAVGEIGMDKYWDLTFIPQQEAALREQLKLASQYNLPVSLHTRNATRETIDIIKSSGLNNLRGVFHCFGGNAEEAAEVTEMGFYLGIGGVVTFKNSGLDKIVSNVSIDKIVLETDGPYLAPAPHRGKINDPAMLALVAKKLSEVYNISMEEVAELTSANARKIFGV